MSDLLGQLDDTPAPSSPPSAEQPAPDAPPVDRDDLSDLLGKIVDEPIPDPAAELTDPRDVSRPDKVEVAEYERSGGLDFDPEFASFGTRFLALLIDGIVTGVLVAPGAALLVTGSLAVKFAGVFVALLGIGVGAWWYGKSVSTTGKWIGNKITNTSVVAIENGAMLTPINAGARYITRHLLSIIFLAGFLIALADSQRRTFHDHVAGSVVIRPSRAAWSIDDDKQ